MSENKDSTENFGASRGYAEWQTSKPPNEVLVEVEWAGEIIEVMAFYGRDGYRSHWKTANGNECWSVDSFSRWRNICSCESDLYFDSTCPTHGLEH